ncbi:MAG: guanylate kinase [bacterium]
MLNKEAKIFVISAPSGTGKSTLIEELLKLRGDLLKTVSYTTRAPRGEEQNGKDYHFVSIEEFKKLEAAGKFIETAVVYGNLYATSLETINTSLNNSQNLIKDIDTQGALNIKKALKDRAVLIFIKPPTLEELENRLRQRGTDSDAVIRNRLENAVKEIKESIKYDYVIVNDSLSNTVLELKSIVDGYNK